ncbi:glycosyltransferase family 4 protein [Thermophagus sp. OGC60D27]|uniref:glycosyltransferase family 4 protein n=1 Tax=Thermophagus sp. OGC60D27 TaxID=3458415 RepID=UPI004037CD50
MGLRTLYISTMAGHPWGGSEELWVKMAHDDIASGKEVHCSIFNWGILPDKIKKLNEAGAVLHPRNRFQFTEWQKKPWGKFIEKTVALKQLKKTLSVSRPDKIIVSMGGFCDLEVDIYRSFLLAVNVAYELIIHVNPENYYLNPGKIEETVRVCQKAEKVWFVSRRLMEIAIRQTGYTFPNGGIIKNPVNMSQTGILPWPDMSVIHMASVGRLQASVKGHPVLFQALAQPEWQNRNWHLNIYGTGPDEAYYRHLVKAFGIEQKCTFHGFVHDIRNEIWANNHILVMPSYYEGLPIALVEAMLCGRPAVVTNVGGNAEVVNDNETGFISEGVHLSSFNGALNRAWKQKEKWKEMGEICFNFINRDNSKQ